MAYNKTTWTNDSGQSINQTNLNKIEQGIEDAHTDVATLKAPVSTKYTPQATPPSHVAGQQYYDQNKSAMMIQGDISGVEVAIGHGMHIHIINNSGAVIEKGMAVRQSGVTAEGQVQIVKAIATSFDNARIFGVTSHEIGIGEEGAVNTFGEINALNTLGLPTGQPLYLSDTVAGTYTEVAPAIVSRVGGCLVADDTNGVLFVFIINNTNIPTICGGLQGQTSGNETYSLTTTVQDIINYEDENSVVVDVVASTGLITLPNNGKYRMHFTASLGFTSLTSTRSVTFEFYDATGTVVLFSYVMNIPRDATEDSVSFSYPSERLADTVHKMRIKASTAMDITFNSISFDIESIIIQ